MAFADSNAGTRYIIAGYGACTVTLARSCRVGDILGLAEVTFDDLGPVNANDSGNATSETILPRLIAGQAGEDTEVITAYPIAIVGGYTGGTLGAKMYAAGTGSAVTATDAGQISDSEATGGTGSCTSVIGIMLDADKCLLFPCARKWHDEAT